MIDRIVSSGCVLLCLMCDHWGPRVSLNQTQKPGNCWSDWIDVFIRNPSGRALVYHLLFALTLNSVYGKQILFTLSLGCSMAYMLFVYILIPIHVKQSTSVANAKTNGIANGRKSSKSQLSKSSFIRSEYLMKILLVCLSSFTTNWAHLNAYLVPLTISIVMTREAKIRDCTDLIMIGSYLLGTGGTKNVYNNLLNLTGGLVVLIIFYLDKKSAKRIN